MPGVKSKWITSVIGAEVMADWSDGEVLQAEAGSGSGERTAWDWKDRKARGNMVKKAGTQ